MIPVLPRPPISPHLDGGSSDDFGGGYGMLCFDGRNLGYRWVLVAISFRSSFGESTEGWLEGTRGQE